MTYEERVEALARCLHGMQPKAADWAYEDLPEPGHVLLANLAASMLRFVYPELHGETPTHWLAPTKATAEMTQRARRYLRYGDIEAGTNIDAAYEGMRDAYDSELRFAP